MTAALFDDAVTRGETKAGPVAEFLRREKWFEQMRLHGLADPGSRPRAVREAERVARRDDERPDAIAPRRRVGIR